MKYIAYCRKSTDEKDKQVLSIESQIAELKEFAGKEKLEVVNWVVESKTAKTPGRAKFEEALRLIESGMADGLLAWHPDRLARNSVDGGRIIYLLDTGKLLSLKFPTFWFENTPQGKFMLNIAFGQSKYYVDNLSENVSRGLRQKIRNGVWPSKAPHGYFNCPQTRTIRIDKKKSLVVKFKSKPRKQGHNFAFTGLIRCGEYGGAITAEEHVKHYPTTRGEVRYVYYRCSKKLGKCSQPFVSENKLVGQLQAKITDIALPHSWTKQRLIWAEEEAEKERQSCDRREKQIRGELKQVEEKTDRLLDLYLEQNLAEEIYKKKQNQLFEEKTKLEGQLKKNSDGDSSWLEPMKEFIDCALQAQKIARKENTNGKIADFAKRVGSNYLLDQGNLVVEYKKPFASLRAAALARATTPRGEQNSNVVVYFREILTYFQQNY